MRVVAFVGANQEMSEVLEKPSVCAVCEGTRVCSSCAGHGLAGCLRCRGRGWLMIGGRRRPCLNCNGTGYHALSPCPLCDGSGVCPLCVALAN